MLASQSQQNCNGCILPFAIFAAILEMTDSVGSRSDTSGQGPSSRTGRMRMDAVCVIDLQRSEVLNQRKKAFEEVQQACNLVNSNCHHVQVILYTYTLIFI